MEVHVLMLCHGCGSKIVYDISFCHKCGSKIGNYNAPKAAYTLEPTDTSNNGGYVQLSKPYDTSLVLSTNQFTSNESVMHTKRYYI